MAEIRNQAGKVFTETSPTAIEYYRHEPGYTVDGVTNIGPADGDVVAAAVIDDATPAPVETPERPADSASKKDWYDYAVKVAEDVPDYEDITHAELVEKYGA